MIGKILKTYSALIAACVIIGVEIFIWPHASDNKIYFSISSFGKDTLHVSKNLLSVLFLVVLIIIFFVLLKKKRLPLIIRGFIGAHHGKLFGISGIFLIIFIFIQLHIVGSTFHHFVEEPEQAHWTHLFFFIAALLLPFFIMAWALDTNHKVDRRCRQILISGLSKFNENELALFQANEFESSNIKIAIEKKANKKLPEAWYWSWNNITYLFSGYHNLKKWIVIVSKKDMEMLNNYNKLTDTSVLNSFALRYYKKGLSVEYIVVENYDDFNTMYPKVKKELKSFLAKEPSKKILFYVTPGNSLVSVVCGLLAIKDNRGFCYLGQSQNKDTIEDLNVNILDMSDLFESYILHKED